MLVEGQQTPAKRQAWAQQACGHAKLFVRTFFSFFAAVGVTIMSTSDKKAKTKRVMKKPLKTKPLA
jgi:hypothetical protein